ncbi:MAG: GIY-YIG nuclease family protein [Bacteroidales bacterium]|nr:GIY-YIG nuclease family protein [Bacteroidales bacterium]
MAEAHLVFSGIIYKYTFPNGKVYIGQTLHPRARHTQHLCESTGKRHVSFWRAYKKYGTVEYSIIEKVSANSRGELCDRLNEAESHYISQYKSDNPKFGYNLTSGGRVFIVNEEGRKHMSEARTDKLAILQYDLDGNFIAEYESTTEAAKTNKTHPGSVWSCCLGKASGKKTKKAQIVKGYTFRFKRDYPDVPPHIDLNISSLRRPVLQFSQNGHFIREWSSVLDAAGGVGCQESGIRQCCYGGYRQSHGYMWRFKDEFDRIPDNIAPVRPKKKRPFPKLTPEQVEKGKRIARERNARPVFQFTFDGDFVAEYPTLDDAAKPFGGDGATICNACKMRASKSAFGYQWRYKEDVPNPLDGIPKYKNNIGRWFPILQYTKEGVFIKEWPGVKAAAKELNIGRSTLYLALTGRKEFAAGSKWKYKNKA